MGGLELKKLDYKDYKVLRKFFELRRVKICEHVIAANYIWKDCYHTHYICDGKGLFWVHRFEDEYYTTAPVCRREDVGRYFQMAEEYFHTVLHRKLKIYAVDEETLNLAGFSQKAYTMEEDRDGFDYVYDAQALRNLSGKKYHQKKNHVNAFYREYDGRYQYRVLKGSDREEICVFLDRWHNMRAGIDPLGRDAQELLGVKEIICHADEMDFTMFGVYIDDKMEAFSLASYLEREKTAFIHVEKANPDIRGLYPFINRQFLLHCFEDAEFVNREDDLGIEGLRKAKLSYHPVMLVKKFNVFEQ